MMMIFTRASQYALAACLCTVALVAPAFGQATNVLFDGGPGGVGMDYLTAENWDTDTVPAGTGDTPAGNRAIMGDPGALNPAVVNLGADAPALWEVKVGIGALGTATFNHSAGALTADNWVVIGDGGTGATPSNGTYNLTGTSALTAGAAGDASVGMGAGGGIGTLNLSSADASVNSPGYSIGVGDDSIGVVNQTAGTVTAGVWMNVGQEGASNGTYNMSGGSLTTPELSVGENGPSTGTFNASDSSSLSLGNARIGRNDGSTGTLNLTGSGVTFNADQFSVASADGGASVDSTGAVNFFSDGGGLSTINVMGNVTLNDGLGAGSTASLGIDLSGGDPGGDLLLIDVGGTLTGQFTGLPEGTVVPGANGRFITYDYLGGGDVALVPEPSAVMLAIAGVLAIGFRRRR